MSTQQGPNLFSTYFQLPQRQLELDFVDIPIDADIPLFIDPFAISQRREPWAIGAHNAVISFFEAVIHAIRADDMSSARHLMLFLKEPNETHFGYSTGKPQGAGIGHFQADQLLAALAQSSAVKTGFLTSLEEAELMVEGISRDKMSDLTTNVIRGDLARYTKDQCDLLNVPVQQVPLAPYYDLNQGKWLSDYFQLPVANGKPLLLVPKVIARFDPAYDHQTYYSQFVLTFLQAEHLKANSSLVHTFKNGRKTVYKKDLKGKFAATKENLFKFSKDHPDVLAQYRKELTDLELKKDSDVDSDDDCALAGMLATALSSIPAGSGSATDYHNLIVGLVEYLFFPSLIIPRKELEIHQGRKRIDIVMENGAKEGILRRLHEVRGLPCSFAAFECKNYRTDVSNPELDQLGGRFSPNRGKLGFMVCRTFEDRSLFIERCRDTFRDDRGLIVPLDDETILKWLGLIADGRRTELDSELARAIDEVWLS